VEESSGGMVILLGITSSGWRNPLDEWLFCQELQAQGGGILWRNGYYARNYKLREDESSGGKLFCQESPALGRGIHRRNSYSARNDQLRDEEFTGGMVILPRMTSSGTRNPPEEWLFCSGTRNPPENCYSAQGRGIHRRNCYPAQGRGIHRRNGYPAGNDQLRDEESTGAMVILLGITRLVEEFFSGTYTSSWTRIALEKWLPAAQHIFYNIGMQISFSINSKQN
jgi:hypothetical protein